MAITIIEPRGPRTGATPIDGVKTPKELLTSLIVTLAIESQTENKIVLEIDVSGLDKKELMKAVLALQRCSNIAT
jgi:hypothetical protein